MRLDSRSSWPRPPKRSEKPSTRSRFPTTLPVSDPRTTSVRPSLTAISAMMSSGAFPKVAFRKPPMPGPVWCAACSVASPISHASGMSAAPRGRRSRCRRSPSCGQQDDHDRAQREQGVERFADHACGTLPSARARRRALRLGRHALPLRVRGGAARGRLEAGLAALDRMGCPSPRRRRPISGALPAAPLRARDARRGRVSGLIREVLAGFGVEPTDEELDRFLAAEHAAGRRADRSAHPRALDGLRERGLRSGLVSNAFDPGWLLRRGPRGDGPRRAARHGRLLVGGREAEAASRRSSSGPWTRSASSRTARLRRRPPPADIRGRRSWG